MGSGKTFEYDAFLSFSTKDQEEVTILLDKLLNEGVKIFCSSVSLKDEVGASFSKGIENALVNSQHMIIYSTENAFSSNWVEHEWNIFFYNYHMHNSDSRRMILFKAKTLNQSHIPVTLSTLQVSSSIRDVVKVIKNPSNAESRKRNSELASEIENLKEKYKILQDKNSILVSDNNTQSRYRLSLGGDIRRLETKNKKLENEIKSLNERNSYLEKILTKSVNENRNSINPEARSKQNYISKERGVVA